MRVKLGSVLNVVEKWKKEEDWFRMAESHLQRKVTDSATELSHSSAKTAVSLSSIKKSRKRKYSREWSDLQPKSLEKKLKIERLKTVE